MVYTAEPWGLVYAGRFVQGNTDWNWLNMLAVPSSQNIFSEDPLVQELIYDVDKSKRTGKNVVFLWAPSLVDIIYETGSL